MPSAQKRVTSAGVTSVNAADVHERRCSRKRRGSYPNVLIVASWLGTCSHPRPRPTSLEAAKMPRKRLAYSRTTPPELTRCAYDHSIPFSHVNSRHPCRRRKVICHKFAQPIFLRLFTPIANDRNLAGTRRRTCLPASRRTALTSCWWWSSVPADGQKCSF